MEDYFVNQIRVADLTTGTPDPVLTNILPPQLEGEANSPLLLECPSFSSEGNNLVSMGVLGPTHRSLVISDLGTNSSAYINDFDFWTADTHEAGCPAWSPTEEIIAYTKYGSGAALP